MSGVPADLGFHIGAGDENRTRTISLGIRPIHALDRPDLGNRHTASDRHGPWGTGVNGPPMARGPMAPGAAGPAAGFTFAKDGRAQGSR
jgi:hypothetical protein